MPNLFQPIPLVEIERDEGRAPSVVDALFTSTQRRLLGLLFGEPTHAFYLRELLALTGGGHGATQREVRRLVQAGLVRETRKRGRAYLQADPRSPIHAELTALVRKTVGLAEPLRDAFALAEPGLLLCFAFEPERDPCCPPQRSFGMLLMPEEHHRCSEAIHYAREQAEMRLGRSFWMLMVDAARLREDPFVAQALQRPRVWVFGNEAALAAALAAARRGRAAVR